MTLTQRPQRAAQKPYRLPTSRTSLLGPKGTLGISPRRDQALPKPTARATALVACSGPDRGAHSLYARKMRGQELRQLSTFEYIDSARLQMVIRPRPGCK